MHTHIGTTAMTVTATGTVHWLLARLVCIPVAVSASKVAESIAATAFAAP